ncbi:MAG: hypothetical protein AABM30_00220 [Actinomycetota bacterium]
MRARGSRLAFTAGLVLALGVGAIAVGRPALAIPSPMTWTDLGARGESTGTFTAAEPLCPSGTFKDIEAAIGLKSVHTCTDGSGTFEFEAIGNSPGSFTGGGTGRYATLRGSGPCRVTVNDDGTFVRTCNVVADFDNTAPSARIERLRLSRVGRAVRMQVTFATADNVAENAVSYRLQAVAAGRRLATRAGTTAGGTVRMALTVRPPRRARRVTISLRVADPLGNARTVARSPSLPR